MRSDRTTKCLFTTIESVIEDVEHRTCWSLCSPDATQASISSSVSVTKSRISISGTAFLLGDDDEGPGGCEEGPGGCEEGEVSSPEGDDSKEDESTRMFSNT